VAGYHLVELVDEHRGVDRSERASQRPGQPDFDEERHAATVVAGNQRPVREGEPPALVPRFPGYAGEQPAGLVVRERQQSQFFASVEPGDDTRRPPAELSGAGIEQNRARQAPGGDVVRSQVSRASIVAVWTVPSTRRASSVSRVMNASACN
jgi:hypothetical protein